MLLQRKSKVQTDALYVYQYEEIEISDLSWSEPSILGYFRMEKYAHSSFVLEYSLSVDILFQIAIFTVIVLPVRALLCFMFLILCWITISIGLYGLSEKDLAEKPLKSWRM